MNRTAIEWCDYSWNIITGCTHNCPYCYARRMAYRLKGRYGYPEENPFFPTFHPDRLLEPLKVKKPAKIFTCSMGEFFDKEVPDLWRDLVFRVILEAQQHTFLILTKQSIPYELEYEVPSNVWFGVSLDGRTTESDWAIENLFASYAPHRFVSIEPLLGPVSIDMALVDWIIIGAQTGVGAKQPRWGWVHNLILEASNSDIPIFIKNNVDWQGNTPRPQEWPEGLKRKG